MKNSSEATSSFSFSKKKMQFVIVDKIINSTKAQHTTVYVMLFVILRLSLSLQVPITQINNHIIKWIIYSECIIQMLMDIRIWAEPQTHEYCICNPQVLRKFQTCLPTTEEANFGFDLHDKGILTTFQIYPSEKWYSLNIN